MKNRVCITGIGCVTPFGFGVDALWEGCLNAKDVIAPIPEQWSRYHTYSSNIWAPLPTIDYAKHHLSRVDCMQQDTVSLLSVAATHDALAQAGYALTQANERKNTWHIESIEPYKSGVFIGTGVGGLTSFIDAEAHHINTPVKKNINTLKEAVNYSETSSLFDNLGGTLQFPPRFNPFIVSMIMPNAIAAQLGIRYSLKGANETTCAACASGTIAIGRAFESIRSGKLDFALAGGAEYLGDRFGGIYRGFDAAKTLTHDYSDPQTANRPFDKNRSGFLFAEGGSAILILESLNRALRRGVEPLAEIVGFAESFDAHNIMIMDPSGEELRNLITQTLDDANHEAVSVDYINTHGTGTQVNDPIEASVIQSLFDKKPIVNSTKSLTGHTIGGAGAIEAAITALSLFHQTTHINKNLEEPIEDLSFVKKVEEHTLNTALTQSFAFGGHNAALLLKRLSQPE